jgi:hypothetical protein
MSSTSKKRNIFIKFYASHRSEKRGIRSAGDILEGTGGQKPHSMGPRLGASASRLQVPCADTEDESQTGYKELGRYANMDKKQHRNSFESAHSAELSCTA